MVNPFEVSKHPPYAVGMPWTAQGLILHKRFCNLCIRLEYTVKKKKNHVWLMDHVQMLRDSNCNTILQSPLAKHGGKLRVSPAVEERQGMLGSVAPQQLKR